MIMMGCCTKRTADAVEWLISDSPRTPKLLIANAEARLSKGAIESKLQAMKTAMEAYYIDVTPVLGLVLGGDLLLHALYTTPEQPMVTTYAALDVKDLTVAKDIVSTMKELNIIFHSHSIAMTSEMRGSFPITRSRSGIPKSCFVLSHLPWASEIYKGNCHSQ